MYSRESSVDKALTKRGMDGKEFTSCTAQCLVVNICLFDCFFFFTVNCVQWNISCGRYAGRCSVDQMFHKTVNVSFNCPRLDCLGYHLHTIIIIFIDKISSVIPLSKYKNGTHILQRITFKWLKFTKLRESSSHVKSVEPALTGLVFVP